MRIRRWELLRQFGAAGAATAFFPVFVESAPQRGIRPRSWSGSIAMKALVVRAKGPGLLPGNRCPSEEAENHRAAVAVRHGVQPENIVAGSPLVNAEIGSCHRLRPFQVDFSRSPER